MRLGGIRGVGVWPGYDDDAVMARRLDNFDGCRTPVLIVHIPLPLRVDVFLVSWRDLTYVFPLMHVRSLTILVAQ